MKTKMLVVAIAACLLVSASTRAGEKMRVEVSIGTGGMTNTTVSIQIGNIEYVAGVQGNEYKNSLDIGKLKLVRVWKGSDSLLYDLSREGVDYGMSYGNDPGEGKRMDESQAATKWAEYLKKFAKIKAEAEIRIRF